MIPTYCWRCRTVMPMLDDEEWKVMESLLRQSLDSAKELGKSGLSFHQSIQEDGRPAFDFYEQVSGIRETNFNALWHHYRSLYGPDCPECGVPFRTHQASFCANCGFRETN